MNSQEANTLVRENAILVLDVRTPVERAEKYIALSKHVPLDQLRNVTLHLPKENKILLVCESGKRANQAQQVLNQLGYQDLHVLDGGLQAWQAAGLPLQRGPLRGLPLMRQVQLIIGLLALSGSLLAITVDVRFAYLPAFLGAGLTFAGATGFCGLAILLSKMPWNRHQSCRNSCSL